MTRNEPDNGNGGVKKVWITLFGILAAFCMAMGTMLANFMRADVAELKTATMQTAETLQELAILSAVRSAKVEYLQSQVDSVLSIVKSLDERTRP